jgi:hypothetical protein
MLTVILNGELVRITESVGFASTRLGGLELQHPGYLYHARSFCYSVKVLHGHCKTVCFLDVSSYIPKLDVG